MSIFSSYSQKNPLTREAFCKHFNISVYQHYSLEDLEHALLLDFLQSDAVNSSEEIAQEFFYLFERSDISKWTGEVTKVFQDRRNEGVFKGLILVCNDSVKIKTLVSWSYDTQVQIQDTPYGFLRALCYFGPKANIFDINSNYQLLNFLINEEHDKNLKDKTSLHPLETKYLKEKAIGSINTFEEYKDYIAFSKANGCDMSQWDMEYFLNGIKKFTKSVTSSINKIFSCVGQLYTPYECSKIFKQSKKELLLNGLEIDEELSVYN